jgi:hypothetical protein
LVGVQQPPVVINAAKRHAAGGRSQSCFSAALSEAMKPVRVRGISPRSFLLRDVVIRDGSSRSLTLMIGCDVHRLPI